MARFALTLAAAAAAVAFVLMVGADVRRMAEGYAYRQHCIISASQLDMPVAACGITR